jgi:argininosuccinate synthase
MRTISPEAAPDKPTVFTMDFENGDPVAIDGKKGAYVALNGGRRYRIGERPVRRGRIVVIGQVRQPRSSFKANHA